MDEKNENLLRKASTLLSDTNYHLVQISSKNKSESDEEVDQRCLQRTKKNSTAHRNSSHLINRNGLLKKQFLFLHKSSCELSSADTKTPPSPGTVIPKETTPKKQSIDCHETARADEMTRSDQLPSIAKKQIPLNHHLEIRSSFHRRQRRFIIACGTVLMALTVITIIIVYVVITTVKYQTQRHLLLTNKTN